MRPGWKSLLLGLVVAVTLSSVATQANAGWYWGARPFYAGWGGWGGGCCGSPCYTVSYCDPCCDSDWYWGWRPGLARRAAWGARWHAVGCCCSSCCVDPCYSVASCCGDVVTAVAAPVGGATVPPPPPPAAGTTPTKAAPAPPPAAGTGTGAGTGGIGGLPSPEAAPAAPALPSGGLEPRPQDKGLFDGPAAPPKPGAGGGLDGPIPSPPLGGRTSLGPTQSDSGLLTVYCPAEAKVTINGLPTRAAGSKRQFVSFGLTPGYTYKYTVVASLVRNGQVFEETQTITLAAGDRNAVAFGFNPAAAEGLAAN